MRRTLAVACAAFAGGALLAGCGGDKDPVPVAIVLTQAGGGDVTLSAPDTIKSGAVEITFDNKAQVPADVEVIGVEGTRTVDEILAVFQSEGGPIPPWLKAGGGVGTTPPGQTAKATIELDEGTYYVISSPESEEDSGPEPASKMLMVSGDGGGSVPSGDTTIATKDYSFEVGELKAGANEIRFENDGKELHHIQAFPIAAGKTIADVKTFFESEGEASGPPPADFEGGVGTAVLDPGKALSTTVNLKAGKYAFVCFIQDRAGGPPHFIKGMLQEVTVA